MRDHGLCESKFPKSRAMTGEVKKFPDLMNFKSCPHWTRIANFVPPQKTLVAFNIPKISIHAL